MDKQRISSLEQQIQKGHIPRHRVRGFMEGFYLNLSRHLPELSPDTVEAGAELLQRYGYASHAKRLLSNADYQSNAELVSWYRLVEGTLESGMQIALEPGAVDSIVYGIEKGLIDSRKLPVEIVDQLDDALDTELYLLSTAHLHKDANPVIENGTPKLAVRDLVAVWGPLRGRQYLPALGACFDTLAQRELEAVRQGGQGRPEFLERGVKQGLYTEADVCQARQESVFNQFWEFQEAMHAEDPFNYAHPGQLVMQAVYYQLAKLYYPLVTMKREE